MIKSVYNGTGVMEGSILETLASSAASLGGQSEKSEAGSTGGNGFDPTGYSERELDIVKAVAEGLSNKEIASKLNLSEGTIRNSLSSILLKLGLRNRTQLAIWAVQSDVAGLRGGE